MHCLFLSLVFLFPMDTNTTQAKDPAGADRRPGADIRSAVLKGDLMGSFSHFRCQEKSISLFQLRLLPVYHERPALAVGDGEHHCSLIDIRIAAARSFTISCRLSSARRFRGSISWQYTFRLSRNTFLDSQSGSGSSPRPLPGIPDPAYSRSGSLESGSGGPQAQKPSLPSAFYPCKMFPSVMEDPRRGNGLSGLCPRTGFR